MQRSSSPANRRDNRPAREAAARARSRRGRKSGAGGTLLGIFIGMALGLALAAAVAFYLLRSGNPYQPSVASSAPRETKEAPRVAKSDTAADKPRFDFYKILPGGEEPKVQPKTTAPDRMTAERAAQPQPKQDAAVAKADERAADAKSSAKAADRFWLQAGSFSGEADAENLKARLALAGWEASVQPADVGGDKGKRYRVRLGPYDNTDELNRVKAELGKRGFDVAVIKY
jgi:cell division protein FtsN